MPRTPDVPTAALRSRTPLRVAAIGASVLLLPGAAGVGGALLLLGMGGSGPEVVGFAVGVLAAAALGVGLLVGYWRAWRSRLSAAQERTLWWSSAVYNGLLATAAVLALSAWSTSLSAQDVWLAVAGGLALAWPVWMTWFGVARARGIGANEVALDGPSRPARHVPLGVIVAAVGSLGFTVRDLSGLWTFASALGFEALGALDVLQWVGFSLAGVALTVGYVWAWASGLPSGVEGPFWWASAGVHAASLLFTFGTLLVSYQELSEAGLVQPWLWGAAGVAWSGWLAWYSVLRAEQAPGSTLRAA